ncbi:DedA family protein [Pigmentiphaga aceris]|uniref:DedA family protein n=1 Tax=Pigmentiphaga aceris TaxID=1940612 RepID=A0A5C0B6U1_9BURK|nr:YqaA family protein [Pigmentiphaga aceris]QEI08691.1 DedA family protein [Pigmentiphaga aceris]
METWFNESIAWLLAAVALPGVGLSAIFIVTLLSATLLPIGSEAAVFGYVKVAPDMFWTAMLVATAGNTAGGMITYYMGLGAHKAVEKVRHSHDAEHADGADAHATEPHVPLRPHHNPHPEHHRIRRAMHDWLVRLGPKTLLLSWLPVVGDPLCAVGGWMRWPAARCALYMAIGKFLRYLSMTAGLLWVFPHS